MRRETKKGCLDNPNIVTVIFVLVSYFETSFKALILLPVIICDFLFWNYLTQKFLISLSLQVWLYLNF